MKKQVIAVDLDDVLASSASAFVEYSNKKWGTNLEVDDYSEHWAQMWGIDIAEALKRRDHIYEQQVQIKLRSMDNAKDVLVHLARNYRLIIVTSRPIVLQKGTIEWIEKYYKGLFEDIHFAGIWDGKHSLDHANTLTKASIIQELRADYFIDDHPKHCFAVAEAGVQSILFGDYSWSRGLKLPERVTRAENWNAIKEYFDDK
ncbi:MAG: hypothetical protein QG628_206 [Patescibacteria group bacterium]|jgi:uncharacterized HAD superfamily protein|nr:hypothetical protein [Patescibacteria group bacterium]